MRETKLPLRLRTAAAVVGIATTSAASACDRDDRSPFDSASASGVSVGDDGVGTGGTAAGDDGDDDGGDDGDGDDGGGPKLDVQSADETGDLDGGEECAEVSETADVGLQPADVIFVIDNSGSMSFEALAVQNNMNAFSSQIFLANIDAHVALISAYPDASDAGVCIPQPLGSGGCPLMDNNLPSFLHVADGVGSNNALEKIIQHYAEYEQVLRPTAAKHVVVVTDDDSDLSAQQFDMMFKALSPTFAEYTFHAIAAPEDPVTACLLQTSCCITSADAGEVYMDLVTGTGGVWGNLCDQDFQPVFDQLSMAVIGGATLACEYDIPPPPDGMDFDADEVNVEFDDGMGGTLEIGRVDDPSQCAGVSHGWYYDDPAMPTKIVVCPQTCQTIQGFAQASVAIKFGCATIPAG